MSKTLYIITSRKLPESNQSGKENFLFSTNQTISHPIKVLEKFRKDTELAPDRIYRVQEDNQQSIIFGYSCLEKQLNKDRVDFVTALLKDVLNSIDLDERQEIGSVKFVMHGYDLGVEKAYFERVRSEVNNVVRDLLLFDSLFMEILEEQCPLISQQLDQKNSDSNSIIEFYGFTHEPSNFFTFLINNNLKEKDLIKENRNIGEQLSSILHGSKETLKVFEIQHRPKEINNFELIELLNQFNFSFFHFSKDHFVQKNEGTERGNVYERLEEIIKSKINPPTVPLLQINIVFTPIKYIEVNFRAKFYELFIEHFHPLESENSFTIPTLFVGYFNVMEPYRDLTLKEKNDVELDPRFRFLDSSIWYRYVAIEDSFGLNFEQNLISCLRSFIWAYENGLYQSNVSKEFLELSNRLLQNSYLDPKFGDGHASLVFPFTFHSETYMQYEAKKFHNELSKRNLKWNILLLDDYAIHPLRVKGEINNQKKKGKLIEELINKSPSEINQSPEISSKFEKHCKIKGAADKYFLKPEEEQKKTTYDVILLDYLFSKDQNENQEIYYGTHLLKEISDAKNENQTLKQKGVLQNYWIFPVTVFPEAMHSSFLEMSLHHLDEDWQLARGADPINTPHLFRCSLFEFMQVQANKVIFTQEEIWRFLVETPPPKDEGEDSWRHEIKNWALKAFRQFLERFSTIEGIPDNSELGRTAKEEMRKKGSQAYQLMEHMRQLLYKLAYSTGFDHAILEREFEQVWGIFELYKKSQENSKSHSMDPILKENMTLSYNGITKNSIPKRNVLSDNELKEVSKHLRTLGYVIYRIDYKYF